MANNHYSESLLVTNRFMLLASSLVENLQSTYCWANKDDPIQ